jgi:mannan endo-1,4-beta-mannosidase
MKFSTASLLSSVLASSALAAPTILSSTVDEQPALAYPIGTTGNANAKVAGRLFDIDGKVQYFAGRTASLFLFHADLV